MQTIPYEDLDLARETLKETNSSIVVIKNGEIICTKKGDGIQPIFETIEELSDEMEGSVVGDKILGKASALLCAYAKVRAIYTPQATKTALAVLIRAGIPGETEELIPFIKNKDGSDTCPFEKMLKDIDSPDEAYMVLQKHFKEKK